MDPISQAALGATVSHAIFHRQLGMKAAGFGALAGLVPDIDTFYGAIEGPFARLVSHRGVTHSLWFGPVVGTAIGFFYWRWQARQPDPGLAKPPGPAVWIGLFAIALLSHPLLDLFTHFGTQLLAPFSRMRFVLPGIPVVDPLYTLTLGLGLALARLLHGSPRAAWCTRIALLVSTAYLFTGVWINAAAEAEARRQLVAAGIEATEVKAFPTMLQIVYRRLLVRTDNATRIGYLSLWRPCPIEWAVAERVEDPRVDRLRITEQGEIFAWFAGGYLGSRTIDENGQTIVEIGDLRYGFDLDAQTGLWGMRGRFDKSGALLGSPEYFRNRPRVSGDNVRELMRNAFPRSCQARGDFRFANPPRSAAR